MEKYTLITGPSSGIGYEFAKIFAMKKHNLILVSRNERTLLHMKEFFEKENSIKVEVIPMDLSEDNAAKRVYQETQKRNLIVDILVNNAGFGYHEAFINSKLERQKKMVKVNVMALMEFCYLYGGDMVERNCGKILNIASIAAFSPGAYMSIYYASKAFVLSFSEGLSEELIGTGVRVTALCPKPTATKFEYNAQMKDSNMFKIFKVANASDVAEVGYKALMKGMVVKYHSMQGMLCSLGSRIAPRIISRKFSKFINRKPKYRSYYLRKLAYNKTR